MSYDFGGAPAGCRHHTCFSFYTGRAAQTAEREVCGGGFAGCPPQQGANLPRTRCQWPLPFNGFGFRNWRSLEPRNVHLSTPPRKPPGKTNPTNPPASGVHSSPAPLVCHADSRSSSSSYYLRSIPARQRWCQ